MIDGSFNLAGIKDPVIDALIDKIVEAKCRDELVTADARHRPGAARRSLLGAALVQGGPQRRPLGQVLVAAVKPKYERGITRHLVVRCRKSCEARSPTEASRSVSHDGSLSAQAPAADHPDAVRDHADQLRHHPVRARRPGRARHRAAHRHRRLRHGPHRRRQGDGSATSGRPRAAARAAATPRSKYRGAQGLDPEFIKSLEKQFGFDKPAHERFFLMMKNYLLFDFGKSYFRDVSVMQLIKEKLPVSISLGLWMMLHHLSHLHPARHPQGRARRRAVRHLDHRRAGGRLRHSRASCSPCCCWCCSPAARSSSGSPRAG